MLRNAPRLSLAILPALLAACAHNPQHEEPIQKTSIPAVEDVKVTPLTSPGSTASQRLPDKPFRADAPETYIVQRGDTLWGIAQRFLHHPWLWPRIWYANPQVKNPHRIYPGDVLTIVHIHGQPRLTKKLSPHMRILPPQEAIPTLPLEVIRPFLTYPQIVEASDFNQAPEVVGSPDGRLVLGKGDRFYALGGPLEEGQLVAVVRPRKALKDREGEAILGFEAETAGTAQVLKVGETSTLQLIDSPRETRRGDRLVPLPTPLTHDLELRPAPESLQGRVISLPDATTLSGRWQVIAIDRGRADDLQPGHVIRLHKQGQNTRLNSTRRDGNIFDAWVNPPVRELTLPSEAIGDAVIFLTYEHISYALLSVVTQPVKVGDCVTAPTATTPCL